MGEFIVSMVRVGVLGATGYTAYELINILLNHPQVKLELATSRQDAGGELSAVHPSLASRCDLRVETFDPAATSERCDVVFSCLPHAASASSVKPLLDAGTRVIDLSADYRLNDVETYEQWYGGEHPDPARVGSTPYGMPELFGEQLFEANLIANPGCYPTSAIMPLAPLMLADLIETNDIIVDAKSGVSGAGRSPKLGSLFAECNENFSAYAVGTHRHGPEIGQILARRTGVQPEIIFTPHLVPMQRGILATIYARPKPGRSLEDVMNCWQEFYAQQPFVRVVSHLPATKYTSGTNYCDMTARESGGRLILLCALDNLLKGASGAAVQNLNCMWGWNPQLGLRSGN
jgi:N-acetyl-gamma-glutamyl-phosphate reductase